MDDDEGAETNDLLHVHVDLYVRSNMHCNILWDTPTFDMHMHLLRIIYYLMKMYRLDEAKCRHTERARANDSFILLPDQPTNLICRTHVLPGAAITFTSMHKRLPSNTGIFQRGATT